MRDERRGKKKPALVYFSTGNKGSKKRDTAITRLEQKHPNYRTFLGATQQPDQLNCSVSGISFSK